MIYRTLATLGAAAVAGAFVVGFGRAIRSWRHAHLDFDFPMEGVDSMFI